MISAMSTPAFVALIMAELTCTPARRGACEPRGRGTGRATIAIRAGRLLWVACGVVGVMLSTVGQCTHAPYLVHPRREVHAILAVVPEGERHGDGARDACRWVGGSRAMRRCQLHSPAARPRCCLDQLPALYGQLIKPGSFQQRLLGRMRAAAARTQTTPLHEHKPGRPGPLTFTDCCLLPADACFQPRTSCI